MLRLKHSIILNKLKVKHQTFAYFFTHQDAKQMKTKAIKTLPAGHGQLQNTQPNGGLLAAVAFEADEEEDVEVNDEEWDEDWDADEDSFLDEDLDMLDDMDLDDEDLDDLEDIEFDMPADEDDFEEADDFEGDDD